MFNLRENSKTHSQNGKNGGFIFVLGKKKRWGQQKSTPPRNKEPQITKVPLPPVHQNLIRKSTAGTLFKMKQKNKLTSIW